MDRFSWCDGSLYPDESLVEQRGGVAVYDGQDKTAFTNGLLKLTTHRLLWQDQKNRNCVISLPLANISSLDEQPGGLTKSAKIVVHLVKPFPGQPPGPVSHSSHSYIRLSFREYGQQEFMQRLKEEVKKKKWESQSAPQTSNASSNPGLLPRQRPGIVGIERSIQQKNKETNKNISQAFQDLRNLMEKAREMVSLSKSIAAKIKDVQGEITEDETVKFKSYLLSMGIPNPVTKETHGTGDKYYTELARQLSSLLTKPIMESGGMMTLTDVYCRVNRARGMELLSPEDLLHACQLMELLRLPIRLRTFDSGVSVLQAENQNEEEIVSKTSQMVEEQGSLTAEQLAQLLEVAVTLARERLFLTEKMGGVCRDETIEGLRFFPNLFLTKT
ncbi:vacuolar protein-sorting-associated protein 36-like [Physella acuta]|uniref:vacuolar protein-sorting-associated protein 36-like n=1 Tax=Physella acuta TaxID=109671 RepID=UPI0027DAF8DB|nr:vacuolar protein-sorting-associated protein 36-like [Physella acuta]XP_059143994.1 vacuolar protein-sorting-associated protein 36-like [Physella acuta]XP_059144071.1 vacuolar protein-sorting-associated protein 36-like [Physella acuta]